MNAPVERSYVVHSIPRHVGVLASGVCIAQQISIQNRIAVHLLVDAVLHQSALTDGRHEAGIALRQVPAIVFGVDRLVNAAVELHQVAEDLGRAQILLPVGPHVLVDHLFALVNQSLSHAEQVLPGDVVVSITDVTRLVLDASQLEQVHSVRGDSGTR